MRPPLPKQKINPANAMRYGQRVPNHGGNNLAPRGEGGTFGGAGVPNADSAVLAGGDEAPVL